MRKHYLPFIILSLGLLSGCATHPKGLETDTVSIPCYKGMNVTTTEAEVITNEDVAQSMQNLMDANSAWVNVTDRPAETGDHVTVNYSGTIDGVPFDGSAADNQILTVGAPDVLDGFTDSFLGHSVGETFQWSSPIPDTYPDMNLWGKTVTYEITIQKIQETSSDSITDEFVSETIDGIDSVKELEKDTKKSLTKASEEQAKAGMRDLLWSELIQSVTIKAYPEDRVNTIRDRELDLAQKKAAFENLSYEDWLSKYHYDSQDAFLVYATDAAHLYLKEVLTAEAILEQEHISVTQKDYDNWMSADFREALEKNHTKDELWDMLRIEKAKDWIFTHRNEITKET